MKQVQARILIDGRLQGMNFRYKTREQADTLGLFGFVRILADGRIEIEAQGEKQKIERLLEWCQEEPHSSQIKSILFRYDETRKQISEFTVR